MFFYEINFMLNNKVMFLVEYMYSGMSLLKITILNCVKVTQLAEQIF